MFACYEYSNISGNEHQQSDTLEVVVNSYSTIILFSI